MNEYIDRAVQLKDKDIDLHGHISELYLKADESSNRPKDLYRVQWDSGYTGICEIKQLILKD